MKLDHLVNHFACNILVISFLFTWMKIISKLTKHDHMTWERLLLLRMGTNTKSISMVYKQSTYWYIKKALRKNKRFSYKYSLNVNNFFKIRMFRVHLCCAMCQAQQCWNHKQPHLLNCIVSMLAITTDEVYLDMGEEYGLCSCLLITFITFSFYSFLVLSTI